MRRFITVITVCAVLLLFPMFAPVTGFAADGDVAKNATTGETYATMQAAIDAASSGDTLQLLADTEEQVTVTKDLTFDFGGRRVLKSEGITLTVKDGAIFTLKSGIIQSSGNRAAVYTEGSGTAFVMTGGGIENNCLSGTSLGAVRLFGTGDSSISGGVVVVNGGSGSVVSVANGTLTVSGGDILTIGTGAALTAGFSSNNETGTITVEDGIIESRNGGPSVSIGTQGSTFIINGGEFSDDVGNGDQFTRADGKMLIKGAGTGANFYALAYPAGTVARNVTTGELYTRLEAAVEVASSGDTIQMVADYNMDDMFIIQKSIVLDLNGKKVTAAVPDGWNTGAVIRTSGTSSSKTISVTIKDSAGGGMIENTAEESGYGMAVYAYSNVTIESGTIKGYLCGIDTTHLYTLTINDGQIIGNSSGMRITGGENIINGGTISGRYRGIDGNMSTDGTIIVNDGEIKTTTTHESYAAIELRNNCALTVNGGTLTGGTGVTIRAHHYGSSDYIPSAIIKGGVINGAKRSISNENEIGDVDPDKFRIEGGYFSDDTGNSDDYSRPADSWLEEVTEGEYAGFWELKTLDKSALQEAVDNAVDPADITESEDGSDVPTSKKWATAEEKAAYSGALTAAKNVLNNARTQDEIDQALADLLEAEKKIKDGTYEEVTVSYDLNGGTLDGKTGIVKIKVEKGSTITLPAPTRDGYTFNYWEGSVFYAGDKFKADEDHNFTAQWTVADTDDDDSDEAGDDAESGEGDGSGKSDGTAKTGDEEHLGIWLAAAVVSALGILVLRRKSERSE